MLYKKYQLEDCKMEIMIPSDYVYNEEQIKLSPHVWSKKQEGAKISINIYDKDEPKEIVFKLQDYYLEYQQLMKNFSCSHILKKSIHGIELGEMVYFSKSKRYKFLNYLLIGRVNNLEVILNLQEVCTDLERQEHVFLNVIDSIKRIEGGSAKDAD